MIMDKFIQQLQRGRERRLKSNLATYRDLVRQYWKMKTKLRNPTHKPTGKPLAGATVHSYRASLKTYEACLDISKHMIRAQVQKKRHGARPKLTLIQGGKGHG